MPLHNFYLSVPSDDGVFVGTRASAEFDAYVSLYEFERSDDNPSIAYFWLAKEAVEWALENVAKRIDPVCESTNRPPKKIVGVLTVETIENGKAEQLSHGNWKVVKKAKIKYTESEVSDRSKEEMLENVGPPADNHVEREPQPEPQSETVFNAVVTEALARDKEFELRVKKDDMTAKLDANIAAYKSQTRSQPPLPPESPSLPSLPHRPKTKDVPIFDGKQSPLPPPRFDTKTGLPLFDPNSPKPRFESTSSTEPKREQKSESKTVKKSNPAGIVVILIIVLGLVVYFAVRPSVETLFNKGKAAFDAKDFTAAVGYFSKAIKRKPDNVEFRDWRGRAFYEQKNYEAAVADFKEAARLSPNAAEYYHRLGEAYSGMNNYESAVTAYTKAIELEPNNANYYFSRAGARSAQKAYQAAVDDFTQAIRIDPSDARFYNSRGGDYRNMGDYDKAYTEHSDAIRLNPSEAKYHNNRGVAQVLRKKYVEAIPDFSEAIRLAPDNARYYNNRGDAYILTKDVALAAADYRMAVQFDPGNDTYRRNKEKTEQRLSEQEEPTDSRDGQRYRAVKIGGKIWMAQNMNYRPSTGNSWCYENNGSNCEKYGRLYDWNTAKTACLSGWHLPSRKEWKDLVAAVGVSTAAKKLKVASPEWNGTDEHKFSARPGGYRNEDDSFSAVGTDGSWWTATDNSNSTAYLRYMSSDYENVHEMEYEKSNGFSVRCVMDAR